MTDTRAQRLGLEPGSTDNTEYAEGGLYKKHPLDREIAHSIAISLKRIADRMDDIASGAATIRIQNEF